jgi:hypothetical protein
MAGIAKRKLMIPNPNEADKADISLKPDSEKMVLL